MPTRTRSSLRSRGAPFPRARRRLVRAAFALAVVCACSPAPPQTPSEFVAAESAAYRARDLDRILELRADLRFLEERGVASESLRTALDDSARVLQRAALREHIRTRSVIYRAGCSARYVSHQEYPDHFLVRVDVLGQPADIVLVRQDGMLKLHPQPSWYR